MTTSRTATPDMTTANRPEAARRFRFDPAETPARSTRERDLARLSLAKSRWLRVLARLDGR